MKELIEKIELNDSLTEQSLKWLAQSKDNGLHESGLNDVIRYLLKKVNELEQKISKNEN